LSSVLNLKLSLCRAWREATCDRKNRKNNKKLFL
jgi:hypothetical protein